ncbi:ead/Ea22-like family protein [Salmonella enterica subsp. enterica]|nr:ead/Ea22-like family protein [Salmonella enterica subsp. enterica]
MSNKIVFVNGKSKCGCVMAFSDGGGEYSDVHHITLCAAHDKQALLDELEADKEQIKTLESRNRRLEGIVDAAEKRIAELERSETQLINERDSAESALNDVYKAVMGQAPEWSNWFSFADAIDEIDLACGLWRNQTEDVIQFRARIAELEARTVNLPKRSVGEVMHMSGFSRDYAEGWCSGNDNARHEIRAAGIKVKGA